eukprot:925572-Pleurochrysis_carterae.AAC.1
MVRNRMRFSLRLSLTAIRCRRLSAKNIRELDMSFASSSSVSGYMSSTRLQPATSASFARISLSMEMRSAYARASSGPSLGPTQPRRKNCISSDE